MVIAFITVFQIALFAYCIINCETTDANGFTVHNLAHISGKQYSYSDVKIIETGYNHEDFYYDVTLNDGTILSIGEETCNEKLFKGDNEYQYLIEIDAQLSKLNVEKKVVNKNGTNYYNKECKKVFAKLME